MCGGGGCFEKGLFFSCFFFRGGSFFFPFFWGLSNASRSTIMLSSQAVAAVETISGTPGVSC